MSSIKGFLDGFVAVVRKKFGKRTYKYKIGFISVSPKLVVMDIHSDKAYDMITEFQQNGTPCDIYVTNKDYSFMNPVRVDCFMEFDRKKVSLEFDSIMEASLWKKI